uniref:Peptidase S1 domain-containing protein n=1 Tax=Anopheles dirus TaxID=7168 RepID=A0A182NWC7_9DIPT
MGGYCVNSGQCSVRSFRLRSNRCPMLEEVCCPKDSFKPQERNLMAPNFNRTRRALTSTATAQPSDSSACSMQTSVFKNNEEADYDLTNTDNSYESIEMEMSPIPSDQTPATSSPSNEIVQNALPTNSNHKKVAIATDVPSAQASVVESYTTRVPHCNTSSINIENDKSDLNYTLDSLKPTSNNNEYRNTSAEDSKPPSSPGSVSENFTYSKCGQRNPDVVVDHKVQQKFRAEYGEFPWTVALFKRAEKLTFCCNGALIGERAILTTAHCVILCGNSTSEIVARVGEWNISTPMPIPSEEIVVKDIHVHFFYKHMPHAYNVALLQLELPVQYRATVQPVCLPTVAHTLATNQKMIASGWSNAPNEQQSTTHQVQKQFNLLHVELQNCEGNVQSFDNKTYAGLRSSVLCATSNHSDQERISDKEEGSPVVVKVSDEYQLHGLVSWGFQFKEEAVKYTVLMNVEYIIYWIKRMMDK